MTVLLHLPFPPSENNGNRAAINKRTGKPFLYGTADKKKFFRDADDLVWQQKPLGFVKGPFTYHLTLNREFRHGNADGQNRDKYALDYAQKIGLIENDKLTEGGSWSWGSCEHGALLSIHPVNVASASNEASHGGQDNDKALHLRDRT